MKRRYETLVRALALGLVLGALAARADNPLATIAVDAAANRRAIDARIYGVAHANAAVLADLNVALNRHGGNPTTRYNWQANADNRGFDWYFESLAYGSAAPGEGWDSFVTMSRNGGAQPMLTVPIIGWVAKLGPNRARLSSFSIAKYGAQQGNDWQWFPDAGNGVRTNGQPVTGNDPNDASVLVDSTFQQQGVQHLVDRWGSAAQGGVRYYILDNEYSIWHSTHRDVRPTGATMDEVRSKMIDHAAKIKAVDPGALVVGPEEWGWSGYFWSGFDLQAGSLNGWSNFPDRNAHGGALYLPWLLDQFRQHQASTGQRLLDIFSVHYYPQGGEFGNDTSTPMQLRRNRSTRSLWDPNYADETWIADKVRLIPRLKEWVAANYPGTPIGLTEYNWGAEGHINGATALADVLGIFGREGLDMAAYWTHPEPSTPAYKAMKMYRNYDGNRSTFGETSVAAGGPNPDSVAVFAAQRAGDRALTVMVINKYLSGNTPARVDLLGFSAGASAQAWQLGAGNAITRLSDVAVANARLDVVLPPQSITLLVIPAAPPAMGGVDLDGDGKGDLLLRHTDGRVYAWIMDTYPVSGNFLGTDTNGWSVTHVADFDGDGKADIVMKHTDGSVKVLKMNGSSVSSGALLLGAGTPWTVTHAGDVNGDGKSDLILRNTDGSVYIWTMNGVPTGGGFLGTDTNGWVVTHVADFNGDGKADIVMKHTDGSVKSLQMDGAAITAGYLLLGTGTPWTVTHAGDVNGDGTADIVLRNTSGSVYIWTMSGAPTGGNFLGTDTNGWVVTHLADFNGDGKADIVMKHTDGSTKSLIMNGTAVSSGALLLGSGTPWTVTHTLDTNGDGKADMVLRHTDQSIYLWMVDGVPTTGAFLLNGPHPWTIVPPMP